MNPKTAMPDRMRIATLGSACALAVFATGAVADFGAVAQQPVAGMGGAPSGGASGGVTEMKPNSVPLSAPEPGPAARPARSVECAEKADARGLEGRARRRFLHACKRGA